MNVLFKFFKEEEAQAAVEYILVTFILILASYGAIRMFMAAWKAKFVFLSRHRAGAVGVGP
ncbi:MAG: hypothetical protein JW803_08875 [Endomicrobiales bacterium]|nr:hypothetical protein [Endomicrobiales bacterium]